MVLPLPWVAGAPLTGVVMANEPVGLRYQLRQQRRHCGRLINRWLETAS
jgi:hypothetical protein